MFNLNYIDWTFDPVIFTIGSLDVRYYGIMWALTILIGSKSFDNYFQREGYPAKLSESIFIWGTVATILGSRIGHCLFYEFDYYITRPWEILTGIRDGGMASHGAALGLLIGLICFSRQNKLPLLWSLDRVMIPVGIGGMLVRIGNLLNSEIFGTATDLPWGFKFHNSRTWLENIAPQAAHPTQLYEAICYFLIFIVMVLLYYKYDIGRRRPGFMFGLGIFWIFFTRFLIEFVKLEQVDFERGMTLYMGQWLSIPFILGGAYFMYRAFRNDEVKVKPIKK